MSCLSLRRQCLARRDQLGLASATLARAVARGALVRVRPGVYGPGPLPVRARHLLRDGVVDPGYLAATRAVLLAAPTAVADRRTAAVLWQLDMLREPQDVQVRVPHGTRLQLAGVDARPSRSLRQSEREVGGWEAVRVTTAADTVLDCALDRPLREAVVIGDSALRAGVLTLDELAAAVAQRARHPRSTRLRRVLALLDPASGSVLESVLRYLLVQAGLTPQSQYVVTWGRERIGRFDFCFELARLIVECDGRRWHDPEDARNRDRVRGNGLTRSGWRLLRFTWAEIVYEGQQVVRWVRESLRCEP